MYGSTVSHLPPQQYQLSPIELSLTLAQRIDLGIATEAELALAASNPESLLDPRLLEPQNIEPEDPITDPQALLLLNYGLDKKARRLNDCRRYGRVRYCKNLHYLKAEYSMCELRYCPICGERLAKERRELWHDPLQWAGANLTGKVVYLEISHSQDKRSINSPASVKAVAETLKEMLPNTSIHFIFSPGWNRNQYITNVLIMDYDKFPTEASSHRAANLPSEFWKQCFPTCNVHVTVDKISRTLYYFGRLVQPHKIKTAEDRAEQEYLLTGTQQFRAVNISLGGKWIDNNEISGEEPLSVESTTDNPSTGPSDSQEMTSQGDGTGKKDKCHRCPVCGEDCNQTTSTFKVGSEEHEALKLRLPPHVFR